MSGGSISDSSEDEQVVVRPRADPNKPSDSAAMTSKTEGEEEAPVQDKGQDEGQGVDATSSTSLSNGDGRTAEDTDAAKKLELLHLEMANKSIMDQLKQIQMSLEDTSPRLPSIELRAPDILPSIGLGKTTASSSAKRPAASPSAPPKAVEKKDAPPRVRASKLEFRRLDELYDKGNNSFYLAETHTTSSAKEDEWEEFVFIVKRRFDWQNRYQKTVIDIKSKELHVILRDHVLKGIQGISLVEDKPTLYPDLLFNYQPQLEEYLEKQKEIPESERDDTCKRAIQHLELLLAFLDEDYAETSARLYPLMEAGEITFDLLWGLFLPNSLLFSFCPGSNEPRVVKLDWAEFRQTPEKGKFFHLDCHSVDYDGKTFTKQKLCLEINDFRGARRIDDLPVFPLAYHEREAEIRDELVERGKKFGKLEGMHYKKYKGIAFYRGKKGIVKVNVDGRVMVDTATFRHINPNYRAANMKSHNRFTLGGRGRSGHTDPNALNAYDGGEESDDDELLDQQLQTTIHNTKVAKPGVTIKLEDIPKDDVTKKKQRPRREYVVKDGKVQLVGNVPVKPKAAPKKASREKTGMNPELMTDEELLLCSPTVLGFSFADKLWLELAVSRISEIEWNTDAFDSLVLPEEQKKILMALVENHTNSENAVAFDDVVKGKGKGLVAVLHGRPGVGKTLTAEGISEHLKRPLYMVSVGELGTDSRTLEVQLSKILEVAHIWGAVLLLDEADVFLERRSVHDIHRNALVSIFLRLLEYFKGLLFLTTNRVEHFDEAFHSRIHIAIRYSDLDQKAKLQIWKTFLTLVEKERLGMQKQLTKSEEPEEEAKKPEVEVNGRPGEELWRNIVSKSELDWLSRRQLNGRQIKNAVRTAHSLSSNLKERLSIKHLKTVLAVTEGFEHDLKGTGQLDSMMSYA